MHDIDVFALPVHPAADVFPMLSDEELDDLAADIKLNGLLQPLVVARTGIEWILVDGRNRREGCRRAGVNPTVTDLNGGTDPLGYIISANVHRRHMTRAQRAMALAMIAPEAETAKERGGRAAKILAAYDGAERNVMKEAIRKARTILAVKPLLAAEVLSGMLALDPAYKDAQAELVKQQQQIDPIAELRKRRPDYADRVVNGELTLDEANTLADRDVERARNQRRSTFQALQNAISGARAFAIGDGDTELLAWLDDKDYRREFSGYFPDIEYLRGDAENIREGARRVLALMDAILQKEAK